jgi:hypothetical protein
MTKRLDLVDRRFGRLVVTAFSHIGKKDHGAWWHCRCDCGALKTARGNDLMQGHVRSCKCLLRETAGAMAALKRERLELRQAEHERRAAENGEERRRRWAHDAALDALTEPSEIPF